MAIPSPAIYLKFDEAGSTDNAVEQVASKNLTRNGTIPAATGILGGGRSFSNNAGCYFQSTDSAYQGGQVDWQWSTWIKHTNLTESHKCIAGKGSGSAYEWILYSMSSDQKPTFNVYNATAAAANSVVWGSGLSTGTWYYISWGYSTADGKIWISVNAGTKVKTTRTVTMTAGTGNFNVGLWYASSYPLNGIVDNMAKFNSTLSDADNTSLYNGGAGRTWDGSSWGDAAGFFGRPYYDQISQSRV